MRNFKHFICGLAFLAAAGLQPAAAQTVPTPKQHFGFDIGTDYMLANYTQAEAYFKKMAASSNRVALRTIGQTEEGRNQYLIIVSSPENIKNLEKYKRISQKMARAEGLTEAEARQLSAQGKAVVWIDGGLHANETVGAHQLLESMYRFVSGTDAETLRILDDVIILFSQVNPDGQELMSNWYMQEQDVTKRNMNIPRLYQKYIGHDNNRDFFMNNMKESTNISLQQYVEWMPQIIYNHHQTSPEGTVVAGPPYRDPFNFAYDPSLITGIDGVGAAMINRLNTEGKAGYTRLSGSVYSTWWNGGLRTTPYFHNMIGILTEITGNPTPSNINLVPERLVPNNATPNPIMPQQWKFKNSIDYSVSLNYAVLDYASRMKDHLLYNIYVMGKNAIEKGQKDNWTLQPKYADQLKDSFEADRKSGKVKSETVGRGAIRIPMEYYNNVYQNKALRDARAYVIPANQRDFPTAVKFLNALIKSGIAVHQASADFSLQGKNYPAGSYVVKTAQAFRPHVLDMFEPQDHPNDFQYPGGPPVRPYDAAGWTLAFSMGVEFDRVLESFDAPLVQQPYGKLLEMPAKTVATAKAGYLLSGGVNNTFIAVNDLLKAGVEVFRLTQSNGAMEAGAFYVPAKGLSILKSAAQNYGVEVQPLNAKPGNLQKIAMSRIALFDQYGGSMPSGWVRWIAEQFHFPITVVYPKDLDEANLNSKYDMILFISGGIPSYSANGTASPARAANTDLIPKEFHHMLGSVSSDITIPNLKSFVEKGGNILTVGSSTALAYHFGLGVKNDLVEVVNGKEVPLRGDKYYIPGSILQAQVDTKQAANFGLLPQVDVQFNNSPVFKLADNSTVTPLAWYGKGNLLRSGWAWGQDRINDGIMAFEAPMGKGKFYAYGAEITFRAQAHSTFKMLFNQLYLNKK